MNNRFLALSLVALASFAGCVTCSKPPRPPGCGEIVSLAMKLSMSDLGSDTAFYAKVFNRPLTPVEEAQGEDPVVDEFRCKQCVYPEFAHENTTGLGTRCRDAIASSSSTDMVWYVSISNRVRRTAFLYWKDRNSKKLFGGNILLTTNEVFFLPAIVETEPPSAPAVKFYMCAGAARSQLIMAYSYAQGWYENCYRPLLGDKWCDLDFVCAFRLHNLSPCDFPTTLDWDSGK